MVKLLSVQGLVSQQIFLVLKKTPVNLLVKPGYKPVAITCCYRFHVIGMEKEREEREEGEERQIRIRGGRKSYSSVLQCSPNF